MPCLVFGRPWVSIEFTLEPSYDVGRSASYYRYYLLTDYLGLLTNSYYLSITLHRSRRLSSFFCFAHPPGWASRGVPQSDTEGLVDWDPEWSAQPYPMSPNP